MSDRVGLSQGDRSRNALLARLRQLLPVDHAIAGIDLADDKQAVVVTDHDSRVIARRRVNARAWELGELLDWAVARARAVGFAGVTVACEPTGHRWRCWTSYPRSGAWRWYACKPVAVGVVQPYRQVNEQPVHTKVVRRRRRAIVLRIPMPCHPIGGRWVAVELDREPSQFVLSGQVVAREHVAQWHPLHRDSRSDHDPIVHQHPTSARLGAVFRFCSHGASDERSLKRSASWLGTAAGRICQLMTRGDYDSRPR
jgi:hypothetical protein